MKSRKRCSRRKVSDWFEEQGRREREIENNGDNRQGCLSKKKEMELEESNQATNRKQRMKLNIKRKSQLKKTSRTRGGIQILRCGRKFS